jgi:ribosomal protein S18 acetylase RimI-like enzyme
MALGTYVELIVAVEDSTVACGFYEQLGFRPVADAVLTDGSYTKWRVTSDK